MIKIVCLVENQSNNEGFESEHGLSLLIEMDSKKILFDTGASDLFLENAKKMDIKLDEVDLVVVSHGHNDHGGGLGTFFEVNNKSRVFMAKGADKKHFKIFNSIRTDISLDSTILELQQDRIIFLDESKELIPDLHILTRVKRIYPLPQGNQVLFEEYGDEFVRDKFNHELIMIIDTPSGLLVFTGCSHSGILNMINFVTDKFPERFIRAVFGGFHLMIPPDIDSLSGTREEVEELGMKLLQLPIGTIYTGHCTGNRAYTILNEIMGDKIQYLSTGGVLKIQ
ncbi:MAG TPA: MBL fold metallo-hydrolase [Methanobacteriaceae archaeon]|nr:MBL fold metallo-hydrolase [Methanobacteriaceae archaeon]